MAKIQKRNFKDSIKYLKKDEWDKLRGSIDNYRDKLIITLLYATGMRISEFCKLRVEDVDFGERFIRIPPENTKTREGRTIFVPQRNGERCKGLSEAGKEEKGQDF